MDNLKIRWYLSDFDSILKNIFTRYFRNLNVLEMESLELQKMVSQSTTQLAVIVAILHWKWVTIPPENGEKFR